MKNMVSIIIVNYHVEKELLACIASIYASRSKTKFKIIVVDNDEKKTIKNVLKKYYPQVNYVPNINKGFGQGNNTGAKSAKGEYILILNPDTEMYPGCIDKLVNYLDKHPKAGIVAPMLYDQQKKLYLQGASELTPLSAIFSFSIINKVFPNNPIANKYWMRDVWDRTKAHEVATVPGAAFMIKRKIFEKLKGFDEDFFLYFEEHDLCRRVRMLDYKIVMLPSAKIFHALGKSTQTSKNINSIFLQSRFYYFRKYYGLPKAVITECILRTNKYISSLIVVLGLSYFLMIYHLKELMVFMGDQAWFYLSARDMILNGTIPLVGIVSSHTWLHQGAFWTYILAPVLLLTKFDPVAGAYISIFFTMLTILILYIIGGIMFTRRIGLIAALLYATSPFIIFQARIPYHTSPIPFLSLLFLFVMYRWINGGKYYLPISIALLAILYNFQISTFLLTVTWFIIVLYGLIRKPYWFTNSISAKNLLLCLLAFIVPMLPMLVYDMNHGFPQTLLFLQWVLYRIALLFGYPSLHPEIQSTSYVTVIQFLGQVCQKLLYLPNNLVAFTIGIFSLGYVTILIWHNVLYKKTTIGATLVYLSFIVGIVGIVATKTVSEAYLPALYPLVFLILALFFDKLLTVTRNIRYLIYGLLVIIIVMNIGTLLRQNYLVGNDTGLEDRMRTANYIVTQSQGKEYNLVGSGANNKFSNFTLNYAYLAWYLGHGPSYQKEYMVFSIDETAAGVTIKKIEKDD